MFQCSPLECFLNNWKAATKHDDWGIKLRKQRMKTLCEVDWPAQTNWPSGGSFDLQLISPLYQNILNVHPDQIPYISTWKTNVEKNPPWLKACQVRPAGKAEKPPVIPDPEDEEGGVIRPPPPYAPPTAPPAIPPGPGPQAPGGAGPQAQASPPSSPEQKDIMPLRRVYDPPGPPGPGGAEAPRTYTVQHIPFSSADVCNWRNQNPSFEENPAKIIKLFEGIFKTYNPTFDDVQYLMDALLTTEETRRIHVEARVHMRAQGTPEPDIITGYPDSTPNWNYQTTEGQKTLTTYRQNVLNGMRRAARKPTNFVKVREVVQGNEEAPGAYLERLKEAYRQYTPVDPDEAANALIVKAAFVAQAAPDVRRKIQKHEGFLGHTLEWMLELAQTTYNQREDEEQKKKEKYQAKKLMALQATAPIPQKRGSARGGGQGRLGRNQCAICRQEGHWKGECPQSAPVCISMDGSRNRHQGAIYVDEASTRFQEFSNPFWGSIGLGPV
uniref:CCHC-type domain-containing protein n=1 Tax=Podarcis muralis TaxID=64176 RepID=A0A670JNE0_PODMU